MVLQNNNFRNGSLAVQYSMYLNVCCAININVYNIFYNPEEADFIVRYELTKGTCSEKCSLRNVIALNLYVSLFLIYIRKALKGFTVKLLHVHLMDV